MKHLIDDLQKVNLVEQRVGADDVGIALIKLAVSTFLRAVGTPHRLYLESLEGELQFAAVLHHKASEWHGEVVAKPLLA